MVDNSLPELCLWVKGCFSLTGIALTQTLGSMQECSVVKRVVEFFLLFLFLNMWRLLRGMQWEMTSTDLRIIWKKLPCVSNLQSVCATLWTGCTRTCSCPCIKPPWPLERCDPCLEYSSWEQVFRINTSLDTSSEDTSCSETGGFQIPCS